MSLQAVIKLTSEGVFSAKLVEKQMDSHAVCSLHTAHALFSTLSAPALRLLVNYWSVPKKPREDIMLWEKVQAIKSFNISPGGGVTPPVEVSRIPTNFFGIPMDFHSTDFQTLVFEVSFSSEAIRVVPFKHKNPQCAHDGKKLTYYNQIWENEEFFPEFFEWISPIADRLPDAKC